MGAIGIIAPVAGYLFRNNPIEAPEPEEVLTAEIRRQRERNEIPAEM
jgi:hypothetical protein